MKHRVNIHGIWKLELECHYVYLFHDGEQAKYLVVQFFLWLNYLDVLFLKPNLISDLEFWLVFTMFVIIFFQSLLSFFKVGYKLCLNVC